MPMFSVRVPEELAERFDTAAACAGGRSALLRRVIQESVVPDAPVGLASPIRPAVTRLMVRLGAVEARHVETSAGALGLSRAGWVAALVSRHATGRPRFAVRDETALLAIQAELRRIGVNVNQIARALNTAVLEGRVLELELAQVEAFRRELRAHMAALRDTVEGLAADWDVEG